MAYVRLMSITFWIIIIDALMCRSTLYSLSAGQFVNFPLSDQTKFHLYL